MSPARDPTEDGHPRRRLIFAVVTLDAYAIVFAACLVSAGRLSGT